MGECCLHHAPLWSPDLLLRFATGQSGDITPQTWGQEVFHHSRQRAWHLPDHAITSVQEQHCGGSYSYAGVLLRTLELVASRVLAWQDGDLCIAQGKLEAWQNVVCEVSPLLLMAQMIYSRPPTCGTVNKIDQQLIGRVIGPGIFPGQRDPKLDETLTRTGLYDVHVHLNGSTPSDVIWLEALEQPRKFHRKFAQEWRADKAGVDDLFRQVNCAFTWRETSLLINIATKLRDWMARRIFATETCPIEWGADSRIGSWSTSTECGTWRCRDDCAQRKSTSCSGGQGEYNDSVAGVPLNGCLPHCPTFAWWERILSVNPLQEYVLCKRPLPLFGGEHPVKRHFTGCVNLCTNDAQREVIFLVQLLRELQRHDSEMLAKCAHYYILIQSHFTRLMVQQVTQTGFDQFQRITKTGLREYSEQQYEARLQQFGASAKGVSLHVEGRVAPKSSLVKLHRMLHTIEKTVQKHVAAQRAKGNHEMDPINLTLVAHFIKDKDNKARLCQFYTLRRIVSQQARLLVYRQKLFPKKRLLVGADAASNELHAPPEVFAPVFRYLRRKGIHNCTFHAGEDFRHLVSGIRAIDEAVTFLDMGVGSRIGHGTAIGIDPALWCRRVGQSVSLTKAEWLDTLVYARAVLLHYEGHAETVAKAGQAISELSGFIYDEVYCPDLLHRAWQLRALDPIKAFLDRSKDSCLDVEEHIEWDSIEKARADKSAFGLFRMYHAYRVSACQRRKAVPELYNARSVKKAHLGDMHVSVPTNFFTEQDMRCLQQHVLRKLVEKNIALETLLSSNVRISFYAKYGEHHVRRWLGCNSDFIDEPLPVVCLGTDDPGIFATSIRNECLHLVQILRDGGLSRAQAVEKVEQVVRNSAAYAFKKLVPM